MVNKLIDGICGALVSSGEFGENVRVYTEEVSQKFEPPCFTVSVSSQKVFPRLGGREILKCAVEVKYFPGSENDSKEEAGGALDGLIGALEYISLEGQIIRGEKISGEISGGALLFKAVYDIFFKRCVTEAEKMGECTGIILV